MSWLFFSVATALLWGIAELFYKKGAPPENLCVGRRCYGRSRNLHPLNAGY